MSSLWVGPHTQFYPSDQSKNNNVFPLTWDNLCGFLLFFFNHHLFLLLLVLWFDYDIQTPGVATLNNTLTSVQILKRICRVQNGHLLGQKQTPHWLNIDNIWWLKLGLQLGCIWWLKLGLQLYKGMGRRDSRMDKDQDWHHPGGGRLLGTEESEGLPGPPPGMVQS